jgi:hypothetical protein
MQPQYVTTAADVAQKAPLTFVVFLLAVILAGVIGGALFLIWRGLPKALEWLDRRAEADRAHTKALVDAARSDAAIDVKRADDAVSGAHKEIGQRVAAVHDDVRRLMVKVGASIFIFLLVGWLSLGLTHRLIMLAAKCEPPCPEGQRCETAIPRKCVEDKKGKEAKKGDKTAIKSSSLPMRTLAGYVTMRCNPRWEECASVR